MTEHYSEKRRTFLKTLTILGGTALTMGAAGKTAADRRPQSPQPQPSAARGYRETDHIRKYYDSARS